MLIYRKELEKESPPAVLPEIFPVVFYHGTEEWKHSLQCADSIDALRRDHVPHFRPFLFDLNRVDNKRLLGSVQTVVGLLSLKYIKHRFTEGLVALLMQELQTFLQMAREMNYRDMEEDIMTREQRLLKEGRQEGLQDSLKRQLKRKFGLESEESVKINQVKDPAKLEAALDEILTAETKQQVLEKLGL